MSRRVCASLALVLLAGTAAAQDAPSTAAAQTSPHLAVSGTLGIATPVGILGLELEAHVARWFSLSAGAGLAASGPQVAAMARAGVPLATATLYGGLGASEGRWVWNELVFEDDAAQKTWNRAYWLNAEVGVAFAFTPTWGGRAFAGASWVINRDAYTCNNTHCMTGHVHDGEHLIDVGLALTRSFYSL